MVDSRGEIETVEGLSWIMHSRAQVAPPLLESIRNGGCLFLDKFLVEKFRT